MPIYILLFLFISFNLEATKSESLVPKFSVGVKKISENLYFGEKEPGLYFFLERVVQGNKTGNLGFWLGHAKEEEESRLKYLNNIEEGDWGSKAVRQGDKLDAGIRDFKGTLDYSENNELWIAYVSNQRDIGKDKSLMEGASIEMAMAVMTEKGAPMVSHMGIHRSFSHLLALKSEVTNQKMWSGFSDEQKKKFPEYQPKRHLKFHPRISLDLHSFAAKVMLLRDPSKLYLITAPVDKMRELVEQALPNHSYSGEITLLPGDATKDPLKSKIEEIKAHYKDLRLKQSVIEKLYENIDNISSFKDELKKAEAAKKNLSGTALAKQEIKIHFLKELIKLKDSPEVYLYNTQKQIEEEIKYTPEQFVISTAKLVEMPTLTQKSPPIFKSVKVGEGTMLRIYDPSRKRGLWEYQEPWRKPTEAKIIIGDKQITDMQAIKRYAWFYDYINELHSRVPAGYLSVDLKPLAVRLNLKAIQ